MVCPAEAGQVELSVETPNGLGAKDDCLNLSAESEGNFVVLEISGTHSALVTERRRDEN
jgi:hypothetical protein